MVVKCSKRLCGATLVEALTALTIITTVMGAAFTVYTQTVSNQRPVLKARARLMQNAFEQQILQNSMGDDLSDEYITAEVQTSAYKGMAGIKHIVLRLTDKTGKLLSEKNYLRYKPE